MITTNTPIFVGDKNNFRLFMDNSFHITQTTIQFAHYKETNLLIVQMQHIVSNDFAVDLRLIRM